MSHRLVRTQDTRSVAHRLPAVLLVDAGSLRDYSVFQPSVVGLRDVTGRVSVPVQFWLPGERLAFLMCLREPTGERELSFLGESE